MGAAEDPGDGRKRLVTGDIEPRGLTDKAPSSTACSTPRPQRRELMWIPRAYRGLSIALAMTSITLSATSIHAQDSGPRRDLESEVSAVKAENAEIRELLRKMEEQQKALLEQVDRMQRRLDGITTAAVPPSGPSPVADAGEPVASDANAPIPAPNAGNASGQQASVEEQEQADH